MFASGTSGTTRNGEAVRNSSQCLSSHPWIAGEPAVDDQTMFQILQDASELAGHFAEKVRKRASEMRAKLAQGQKVQT